MELLIEARKREGGVLQMGPFGIGMAPPESLLTLRCRWDVSYLILIH